MLKTIRDGTQDDAFEKALFAIENDRENVLGAMDNYLRFFTRNLERFRIREFEGHIDDAIVETLDAFLPMRDQCIRLLVAAARYDPNVRWIVTVHRFIERLIHYTNPPHNQRKRIEYGLDNFSFILHELFLYAIAILLKFERLEHAAYMLSNKYYVTQGLDHGFLSAFDDIHKHMGSLVQRNERLGLGLEALRASMLRERCVGTEVTLNDLMQADFTIFLRAELRNFPEYSRWWPELLMFLREVGGSFEMYVRAGTKSYFDQLRLVVGINEAKDLQQLIDSYKDETRKAPRGMQPRTIAKLVGYEFLLSTTTS
ncbi:MAG: hypothetical protein OEM82_10600 [Acidobacteriota bacterium]|nr:hypothetical protein [Acidobacteriota bacterium]MDH3528240.1 hypothetical protein [Acidobacteriota bacterium]